MAKKAGKNRKEHYEPKLELDDKVEFDDLFKVAINHDQKKQKPNPTKKKKPQ
jgi:hypothetical protein